MNEKKFYLIYKITNNVNQKFYIGKHETNNLDDDYFGSGKLLNYAKEKYGLENFTKTILFYCHNQEEMNLLEKYVVTFEFCQREDVYNIMEGGNGGWQYLNKNKLNGKGFQRLTHDELINFVLRGRETLNKKLLDEEYRKNYYDAVSNGIKQHKIDFPDYMVGENNPMFGKKHTQKSCAKMSNSKRGEKNNRYGSKWYYDPVTFESHSFLPNEEIPNGWIRGRKIKRK